MFDYEGTEIERKLFRLKGNHRVVRYESDIYVEPYETDDFEKEEESLSDKERDAIVARLLYRDGSYWVFHKQLIDETLEQVCERKPEEKIWQIVRETMCAEMDFPCYRIQKDDLLKVGRVRFKVREINSPVYKEIEAKTEIKTARHK